MIAWYEMQLSKIIGGKDSDGVAYLKLFLIDYKQEFNVETVNPSCKKCLADYHDKFIKKYSNMENTSNYRLHKKREGLQLEAGSSIFVNNRNITDKYAGKLIERFKKINPNFKMSDLFDIYPTDVNKINVVDEEIVNENINLKTKKNKSRNKPR